MILKIGGSITAQNHDGQTPLMLATKWKNLEVFHELMGHSNSETLNQVDKNGNSIGHYVCYGNLREFLLCLYGCDIDMTIRNRYGLLPFELCMDEHTLMIFSKLFKIIKNPELERNDLSLKNLQKLIHLEKFNSTPVEQKDVEYGIKQAENHKDRFKKKITDLSTSISGNDSKILPFDWENQKRLTNLRYKIKQIFPDETLEKDFVISIPFAYDFLKKCNDFKCFKFEKPIGIGGFGEVWVAVNLITKKRLAVKVVNLKSKVSPKTLRNLVRIERDVMTSIDFPFICKCLYSFKSNRRFYLFMEYCPYRDLGYLSRVVLGGFQPRMVMLFLAELVLAIEHLHDNNIIHRDLKTENVLMDSTGHIKLTGRQNNQRLRSGKEEC